MVSGQSNMVAKVVPFSKV